MPKCQIIDSDESDSDYQVDYSDYRPMEIVKINIDKNKYSNGSYLLKNNLSIPNIIFVYFFLIHLLFP